MEGDVGLVWATGGRPQVAFALTIDRGRIVEIELIADPDRLERMELSFLD